jgi:PBP1b-binding outer membrane lipoprotein LpoB
MKRSVLIACSLVAIAGSTLLSGCASYGVRQASGVEAREMNASDHGFVSGTGIESQDIVTVADKMARGIIGIPQIANAQTPPSIVMLPVQNDTRFAMNKNIFLEEIMSLVNERASGKMRFLARERMAELEKERELKRGGQLTTSTDVSNNQFKGADYMLTGKLTGVTTKTSKGTSDYILYSFELIDPNTTEVIWSGSHRIKKQGQDDAVYR